MVNRWGRERAGRPIIISLALTALAAILAAALWALLQEPPPLRAARLPDGSVLRLEAVTVGPQHRFVSGRRWQRLLATVLPPGMSGSLRGLVHGYRGPGRGEVVFWTVWRPAQLSPATGIVFGEHSGPYGTQHIRDPAGKDGQVTCWVARKAPQRGAWIALCLKQPGTGSPAAPLAEFRVPSPFRVPGNRK